jgi:SAM-dependent methyltransferase
MHEPSWTEDPLETANRRAYDRMADNDHCLTMPVTAEELARPLAVLDARGWLGPSIRGWHVLCLAAGGGRHGPLYAAAGAIVTVVDISPGMLERDRQAAAQWGMEMRIVQASMLDLHGLGHGAFDLVAHPVSTCYVSDLPRVFSEVSRVLKPGGLYVSQHKQPINLQASLKMTHGHYVLETEVGQRASPVPAGESSFLREPHTIEIAHSLESILGGICRSSMVIEDVTEPEHAKRDAGHNTMGHRSRYAPPYLRIKARKRSLGSTQGTTQSLLLV